MNSRMLVLMALALVTGTACTPAPIPGPPGPSFYPPPTYTPGPTSTLYPTFSPIPQRSPTAPPTRTELPTAAPAQAISPLYVTAFGIDYARPEKYIMQGEQTALADPSIVEPLRRKEQSLANLGEIYWWIAKGFKTYSAGGATIGQATANSLLAERRLGGCHDWGLVFAAIARQLGYPAVMVDTAGIPWIKQVQAGEKVGYSGHVFVEVFVANRWVLIDSTNNYYVESGYDPANPIIPLKANFPGENSERWGFYVMRKGVDTWGYGIRSNAELTRLMDETARQAKLELLPFPRYTFTRFSGK